jgi:hypothetical protein
MNTDNFTDQEMVLLGRECIIRDDFTTFSRLVLSCRRREGPSPATILKKIRCAITLNGDEKERDRFRQYHLSVDGAADILAQNTGTPKREVMWG